jgi:uncharacterized protein (DUF2267 family)
VSPSLDPVVGLLGARAVSGALVIGRVRRARCIVLGMSKPTEPSTGEAGESSVLERLLSAIEAEAVLPAHVTPVEAAVVATSTLFALLTPEQAHDVVTGLPAEVQPLFEHSYTERGARPASLMGRAELVDCVADRLAVAPVSAEVIIAAVFHVLTSILPPEQANTVAQQLPLDSKDLWLSPMPTLRQDVGDEPELLKRLLHDIETSGALSPRVSARAAFASVMCGLVERLPEGEARRLVLGLPRMVRPLVTRCLGAPVERSNAAEGRART